MSSLILHFDGACWKNPGGVATYGWAVITEFEGKIADARGLVGRDSPDVTNNVAEYTALQCGLTYLYESELDPCELVVRGDSQLVIKQIKGEWNCNRPHLQRLRDLCRDWIRQLENAGWTVKLEWVAGRENAVADRLAVTAWEQITGRSFPDLRAMKRR